MKHLIQAACGCHVGKIRKNNEDNFFFDGNCLARENSGLAHPATFNSRQLNGLCFAVFDGMGGENYGEYASHAAAQQLQNTKRSFADRFISSEEYLERLTERLNKAVTHAQTELRTDKMGSTMVSLYFSGRYAYICNVGDSRAYRFRNGELVQLSADHVEKRPGREGKKAPLTQHLGLDVEEILIEPHITKDKIQSGDMYLLCSDGVTDMLTDSEISEIMLNSQSTDSCVSNLIDAALEHGGRDNITAIVCKLM